MLNRIHTGWVVAAGLLSLFVPAARAQESAFLAFPGNYRIAPGASARSDWQLAPRAALRGPSYRAITPTYRFDAGASPSSYARIAITGGSGYNVGFRDSLFTGTSGYNSGFYRSGVTGGSGYNVGFRDSLITGTSGYNSGFYHADVTGGSGYNVGFHGY